MGDRAYILLKKKYSARMIAMCCRLSELRTQLEECQSGAGGGEVSIEINGLAFGTFECGTTVDVPVVDSMDLPIDGLTIEAGKVIIPDCPVPDDAEVRINTSPFKFVPSGGLLDITVEYENGIPVGDLEIPDNKIIIPDVIVIPTTRIYNKAMDSGSTVSYADGDTYYRKINEIGKLVQPEVGVVMRLQFGSSALLEYPNIHGSLYRVTGLTGGYRDPIDGLYYTKLNVLTTYAEAFPFDIGIDHFSSDLIDMRATGNNVWATHCANGLARTTAGFTGWYLLSVPEGVRYGNWGNALSYNNGNPPFDWGTNLKVLGDTYAGGTTQCMVIQTYAHITSTAKANNNKAVFMKPINVNTDIPIT